MLPKIRGSSDELSSFLLVSVFVAHLRYIVDRNGLYKVTARNP